MIASFDSGFALRARPSRRMPGMRGFTLVEVLIATSLLAIIGLAIAETLRAARDADKRLAARSERRAQDRAILDRIAKDIRALVPPGGGAYANVVIPAGTLPLVGQQQVRGGGELLSLATEESAADEAANELQAPSPPYNERDVLTLAIIPGARRYGSTWPAGTGSVQIVVWQIDDDPATLERGLVRRPTAVRDPVAGAPAEPCEVVCANACGLMFRYYDGTQWQDSWDTNTSQTIPQAIEVSVAVRDPDGTIRRLVTVVAPQTGRPATLVQAAKSS